MTHGFDADKLLVSGWRELIEQDSGALADPSSMPEPTLELMRLFVGTETGSAHVVSRLGFRDPLHLGLFLGNALRNTAENYAAALSAMPDAPDVDQIAARMLMGLAENLTPSVQVVAAGSPAAVLATSPPAGSA